MKTHDLTKGPCPHCGTKNDDNLYEIDYEKHTVKCVPQTDHRCLPMAEAELLAVRELLLQWKKNRASATDDFEDGWNQGQAECFIELAVVLGTA